MDTIFSHHGNQKFWKLRACSEDTLPKILPRLVIKVPTSHFAITSAVQPVHERSTYFTWGRGPSGYPLFHFHDFPMSPRRHVTTSPRHHVTTSPRHHVTTSPRHHVASSVHTPFTLCSRLFTLFYAFS